MYITITIIISIPITIITITSGMITITAPGEVLPRAVHIAGGGLAVGRSAPATCQYRYRYH